MHYYVFYYEIFKTRLHLNNFLMQNIFLNWNNCSNIIKKLFRFPRWIQIAPRDVDYFRRKEFLRGRSFKAAAD